MVNLSNNHDTSQNIVLSGEATSLNIFDMEVALDADSPETLEDYTFLFEDDSSSHSSCNIDSETDLESLYVVKNSGHRKKN